MKRECRNCKYVGSFEATPCRNCEKPGYTKFESEEFMKTKTEGHTRETLQANIQVKAFKGDGKPTCAIDFRNPKEGVCVFLRLKKLGCMEICGFTDDRIEHYGGDHGFLKPVEGCPVWKK